MNRRSILASGAALAGVVLGGCAGVTDEGVTPTSEDPVETRRSEIDTSTETDTPIESTATVETPTSTESMAEYKKIELSEGSEATFVLRDDEIFENVLIDQRADGAKAIIDATGVEGWTIRNIGFLGEGDHSGFSGHLIGAEVPSGGSGLIENVYINQILNGSSDNQLTGIRVPRGHAGHLDIRHTYIRGCGGNAVYGSDPGKSDDWKEGQNGRVIFENCYHRDNTTSQYRIGTPGSSVRNCVGILDDPDHDRGTYPETQSRDARCVWARHHLDQSVENSSFYINPEDPEAIAVFVASHLADKSNGERAEVEIIDCDVNADAPLLAGCSAPSEMGFFEDCDEYDLTNVVIEDLGIDPTVDVIQDGVPTSPEMAARGEREMPPEIPDRVNTDPLTK